MDEGKEEQRMNISQQKKAPSILEMSCKLRTEKGAIAFLRNEGLLRSSCVCSICNVPMSLVKTDGGDGEMFRCAMCYSKKSVRQGSFFERSKLKLSILILVIYCFGIDLQVYQCMKLLPDLAKVTVIDWFNFCRDICSRALIERPCCLRGDVSGNVEIDESLFGKKRKYHRGSGNQKVWVFGATEKNTRNCFMQIVPKRDREILMPIIKENIAIGSTIFSDKWAAYFTLAEEGYEHDTVNHSEEFKSQTGCCTNTIEGLWGNVKLRIKKMKGVYTDRLPCILDEYMYRYRFGASNGDVFYQLLADIKHYYGFEK